MRRGRLAILALALLLGACARPPGPTPQFEALAARYRALLGPRAAALGALTADLALHIDGRATGRLPGLLAQLSLSAPEHARLRASWLLGTAVDVTANGDSVLAWVPSQRLAVSFGAAGESLGVHAPIALLARALGATWDPPDAAWAAARADSGGVHVTWAEGGDSLAMVLGADERPARVRIWRVEGAVDVRYTDWEREQGQWWPHTLQLADETGWARVRLELEHPRFVAHADPAWFRLRLPDDTRRVDWRELRDVLGLKGRD